MKRIKLFIAGAAVMATMVVGAAAPAMAMDKHSDAAHLDRQEVKLDNTLLRDNIKLDNTLLRDNFGFVVPDFNVVDLAPVPPVPAIDNGIIIG